MHPRGQNLGFRCYQSGDTQRRVCFFHAAVSGAVDECLAPNVISRPWSSPGRLTESTEFPLAMDVVVADKF
jgi:hypothetical protein